MITSDDVMDMFIATVHAVTAAYEIDCLMLGPEAADEKFNIRTNAWMDANQGEVDGANPKDLAKAVMASALILVGCIVNFEGTPDE